MDNVTPSKMGLPRTPGKSRKGKEQMEQTYQRAFDEQWAQRESQMQDYFNRELEHHQRRDRACVGELERPRLPLLEQQQRGRRDPSVHASCA